MLCEFIYSFVTLCVCVCVCWAQNRCLPHRHMSMVLEAIATFNVNDEIFQLAIINLILLGKSKIQLAFESMSQQKGAFVWSIFKKYILNLLIALAVMSKWTTFWFLGFNHPDEFIFGGSFTHVYSKYYFYGINDRMRK